MTLVAGYLAVVVFCTPGGGWAHFAVAALFAAVFPYAGLYLAARAGRTTNTWVSKREQRGPVYAVMLGSIAVGLALLRLLQAPGPVMAAYLFFLGTLVLAAVVNRVVKISVHAMVAASLVGGLWPFAGPWALAAAPVAAAVAWARVVVSEHEPREVQLGLAAGLVIGALLGLVLTGLGPR